MVGIEDPVDQPGDNIQPQDLNPAAQILQNMDIPPQAAQPRARRTHKDDLISSLLSKLSFREKLSKNKEIEDQNKDRELRTYNHHLDPVAHPEPGSENASFVTMRRM
jgi:hypothetical protein